MNRCAAIAVLVFATALARAETRPLETGGFAFDLEAKVSVPPARAFDAFTRETLAWWDHHFSEHPKSMSIDTRPGGGFVEIFDDTGNGVWHATVIYAERPKILRLQGPLGLSGNAIDMVHTLRFEPVEGGTSIKLSVHAAGEYNKAWPAIVESVWRHFLVEQFVPYVAAHPDGPAATGSATSSATPASTDPLVAATLRYREAKKRGDVEAQRALLAPGARMWFESKEGTGSALEAESKSGDPWEDWDHYFHSASSIEATSVERRTVRLTVTEVNDWYRLVDRPPSRYFMSYDFDEQGRITGVLVHPVPDTPKSADRLGEFKTWAKSNRSGLVETLMPAGKLDPSLEKAKTWKAALVDWRKAAGLPMPEGVTLAD